MPANLPPQYFETERKLKTAKSHPEKIEILEELLAIIPKHKGTEKMQALLKTKIAKLRDEMQRRPSTAKRGPAFHIEKTGAGQIILIGPPNSGKSLLIKALTGAEVEVGDYPFTTRAPSPFMMPFRDIKVQLIDTPPMTADFMETWLPEIIKVADGVLLVADASDPNGPALIEGILARLRDRKIEFVPETQDIPPEKAPFWKKGILVVNKVDTGDASAALEEAGILFGDRMAVTGVSALSGTGIEELRERIFQFLRIIRAYSKAPGKKADLDEPFVLKKGSTVLDMARAVHKDFAENFKFARVWNKGGLDGLRVTRDHVLEDGDIVEIHM